MARLSLIAGVVCIMTGTTAAQICSWIQTAGYPKQSTTAPTAQTSGHGVGMDGSGNVYVTGLFHDTTSFGSQVLTANGKTDIFIVKYNSAGAAQWARKISSTADKLVGGIAVDASGNSYVVGNFNLTTNFAGLDVVSTKTAGYSPSYDYFIISFDADGNRRWLTTSTGVAVMQYSGVALNASGSLVVMGGQSGAITLGGKSTTQAGYFIGKVNPADGTLTWLVQDGTGIIPSTAMGNIAVDASGNVALTGNGGILALNVGGTSVTGGVFTAYYNSAGTFQWVRTGISPAMGSSAPNDVAFDNNGAVYVGGIMAGTATFDAETLKADTGLVTSKAFVAKYSSAGALQWMKGIGGQGVENVLALSGGTNRIFVSGSFQVNVNFAGSQLTTNAPQNSAFLVEYSADGTATTLAAGQGNVSITPAGLAVNAAGELYLTGNFQGRMSFGAIAETASTLAGQGAQFEMFTLRYTSVIGINDRTPDTRGIMNLEVSPNPVMSRQFAVHFPAGRGVSGVRLLDVQGNVVNILVAYKAQGATVIVPAAVRPGIYLVELTENGQHRRQVVIIQ
jgi:hypothetical protein